MLKSIEPTWLPTVLCKQSKNGFGFPPLPGAQSSVCSVLQGPSLRRCTHSGLTEAGFRNARSGPTTLYVPSCPEEPWICSCGWKVKAERRGNNGGHATKLWDTNTGDILELRQECWSRPRRPRREARQLNVYLLLERERGRKKDVFCSTTCAENERERVWFISAAFCQTSFMIFALQRSIWQVSHISSIPSQFQLQRA